MPRAVLRLASVLTATLLVAFPASGHPFRDDAGTGADAGDTPATALALPGYGSYLGYVLPHDSDWYSVAETRSPLCVVADFEAAPVGTAVLSLDGATPRMASTGFAGSAGRLAIASPDVAGVQFGIGNTLPDFRTQGDYAFSLAAHPLGSFVGDGGSGMDASRARPVPVGTGCGGGSLDPLFGLGDEEDSYAFPGAAGEVVTLSFAQGPAMDTVLQLDLLSPQGIPVATLQSGDVTTVTLPTSGTYTMRAGTAGVLDLSSGGQAPVDYLYALIDGAPGSGCRPTCV